MQESKSRKKWIAFAVAIDDRMGGSVLYDLLENLFFPAGYSKAGKSKLLFINLYKRSLFMAKIYNIKVGTIIKPDTADDEEKDYLDNEIGWIFLEAARSMSLARKKLFHNVIRKQISDVTRYAAAGYFSVDDIRKELWEALCDTMSYKYTEEIKSVDFFNQTKAIFEDAINYGLRRPKQIIFHFNPLYM